MEFDYFKPMKWNWTIFRGTIDLIPHVPRRWLKNTVKKDIVICGAATKLQVDLKLWILTWCLLWIIFVFNLNRYKNGFYFDLDFFFFYI